MRPRSDVLSSGWWHIFTSHLTFSAYGQVIHLLDVVRSGGVKKFAISVEMVRKG